MVFKIIIKIALGLHNICYKIISVFAYKLEKDGLHPKHRIMRYHDWFVDNIESAWKILDVGCGNGALTFDIAKKSLSVEGIDISEKNIEKAKEFKSLPNINYIIGNVIGYDFNHPFDAVVLSNVLEHIEDRVLFLKKLGLISKRLLIRVPLLTRDWLTSYKKEMGVEWRLDKTHYIEYTPQSFEKELNDAGFVLQKIQNNWGEIYAIAIKK